MFGARSKAGQPVAISKQGLSTLLPGQACLLGSKDEAWKDGGGLAGEKSPRIGL